MNFTLLADVGGSKSRFALSVGGGRPERILVIDNNTVADLETAIAQYLELTGSCPEAATIAIAGPIDGEDIALTNRAWRFRRSDLAKRFRFLHLQVINDFEAIAWALRHLGATDTRQLGKPVPSRHGVKIVLGPGTGLGVAALVPAGDRWHVVASEGGHASFGAREQDEVDAFRQLSSGHNAVSAETILSGPGLARLNRALDPHGASRTPENIVASAITGELSAQATVRLFVRLLGRFAGDMALTFKSIGGVYLTGGVACALGPLLDEPQFRAAFEAHPPYETMLAGIPTLLVTCAEPGLVGCAALADCVPQIS